MVAMPLFIVLCLLITVLTLDHLCYTGLSQRLPLYPGASVVFESHNGPRIFGMGQTLMILETDDPVETVREWYGINAGGATRRMQQSGQRLLIGIADASYSVITAEDGTGTQITLSGACGG